MRGVKDGPTPAAILADLPTPTRERKRDGYFDSILTLTDLSSVSPACVRCGRGVVVTVAASKNLWSPGRPLLPGVHRSGSVHRSRGCRRGGER